MTQYNPLPPAKPERARAVPGLTANISFMENINHLLQVAAWDTVTKHREGAAIVLGELWSPSSLLSPLVSHKASNNMQGSLN